LRTALRGFQDSETQVPHLLIELLGENAVAVMDQKTVAMVGRQRFTQLLDRPWRRGMRRHIGIQNPASRMFHDHKDIEETKGRRHHHAEVTGDDGLGMIANKGPSALG
jgi:hypothetical protein